jgi:Matrixin
MAFLGLFARTHCAHRSSTRTCPGRRQARPRLEGLEDRVVPYAVSGDAWPNPQLVTISFIPDGTNLGGVTSDLFAAFDARFGSPSTWENVILKAAQSWAAVANINFTVIPDSGADSGSGSLQQGDPTMGDIRIGGFDMQNTGLLALAYMPPPVNNFSIAGDIGINTAQVYNINSNDYDLYTVMAHEIGHALGLDHSTSPTAIMYATYEGVDSSLGADDIAGIQSIYGARQPDLFDAVASNGSFATASDITSYLDPTSNVAQLPNLDISSTGDVDYYSFVAPADSASTMTMSVQSAGLSLLAPSLRVYDSNQQQIGFKTGTGDLGATDTFTLSVTPGSTYYIRVAGANATAFGTGAYALTVNLGSDDLPAVTVPDTTDPNGDPLNGGGGLANRTAGNGVSVAPVLVGLDRTVSKLTGGLLGGIVSRIVDKVVTAVIDLPFVDALMIPTTAAATGSGTAEVFALPAMPALQSTIVIVFDVEATERPTPPPTTTPSSVPAVKTLAPPQIVLGIGAADMPRTSFDVVGERPSAAPGPSAVSAALPTSIAGESATTFVNLGAASAPALAPIVAADPEDADNPEARPVAVLSLVALAVGLNPPLSADEQRRPFPGR